MSQLNKKTRELAIFSWAQSIRPERWPTGAVDHSGENPDIVVSTGSQRYGVELTEEMFQSAAQSDAAEARICALAKEAAEARRGIKPGLRVTAAFGGAHVGPIAKRHWAMAADELLKIVEELDCGDREQASWSREASVSTGLDSHVFEAVWVHYLPGGIDETWQPSRAGFVRPLSAGDLQQIIDRKNARVADYRTRAQRVDLLIAVNGATIASAACLSDEALAAEYMTTFDGVFVLDILMRRIHELYCEGALPRSPARPTV